MLRSLLLDVGKSSREITYFPGDCELGSVYLANFKNPFNEPNIKFKEDAFDSLMLKHGFIPSKDVTSSQFSFKYPYQSPSICENDFYDSHVSFNFNPKSSILTLGVNSSVLYILDYVQVNSLAKKLFRDVIPFFENKENYISNNNNEFC